MAEPGPAASPTTAPSQSVSLYKLSHTTKCGSKRSSPHIHDFSNLLSPNSNFANS
jgi:hypothetical protein